MQYTYTDLTWVERFLEKTMEFDSTVPVDYPTQTARPRNGSIFIPRVRFLYSLHTSLQSWPMLLHRGWRVEETIHTSAPVIMAEGWCGPFPSLRSSRRSESTTRVTRLVCSKVSCDGSGHPMSGTISSPMSGTMVPLMMLPLVPLMVFPIVARTDHPSGVS